MAVYKELNPEIALKAIEGYEDVLTEEGQKLDDFYSSFSCPRGCGPLQRENDSRHAFSDPNVLVPRSLLRCRNCNYLIEPHSRNVIESGSAAKIPFEISPIIQPGKKMIGNF